MIGKESVYLVVSSGCTDVVKWHKCRTGQTNKQTSQFKTEIGRFSFYLLSQEKFVYTISFIAKQYMEEYRTMQLVVCLFFSGVEQLLVHIFSLCICIISRQKIDAIKLLRCLINHQINVSTKEVTRSHKYS